MQRFLARHRWKRSTTEIPDGIKPQRNGECAVESHQTQGSLFFPDDDPEDEALLLFFA